MIRAFELALRQLGDPRLRSVIWQSLALSLVLQVAIGVLAWWALQHYAHADIGWIGSSIVPVDSGADTAPATPVPVDEPMPAKRLTSIVPSESTRTK